MSSSSSQDPKRFPTLRQIAKLAGVSHVTVSLALRGSKKIPAARRKAIERIAEELEYRPDPQLNKLMSYVRNRRPAAFKSTIAAVTTIPQQHEEYYVRQLWQSARTRATALGYGFDLIYAKADERSLRALQRTLLNRGVEGILLLPMRQPFDATILVTANHFTVVAATYGVVRPEVHRVVPHQFGNMLLLCRHLAAKGYRRLGFVTRAEHDLTVNHGFTGAVSWQNALGGTEWVNPFIATRRVTDGIETWFRRERPDVIIVSGDAKEIAVSLGLKQPDGVPVVVTDWVPGMAFSGIDERPEEIGMAAIDLLTAKIRVSEKGIPAVPSVLMINGRWVDPASAAAAR